MRRRLNAAEIADAAISAALVLALLTVGRLLAAGTFFQVLATAVMAVLAARRRARVVVTAVVASMAMALLLGGVGPITQAFVAGLFGWTNGVALRRGYKSPAHIGLSIAVGWPVVSAATVGFLWIFSDIRDLTLENGRNQWLGIARLIRSTGLDGAANSGTDAVNWSIDHWWLMVPALQIVVTIGYALIIRRLGRAVLQRVERALAPPWAPHLETPDSNEAGPLPLSFGPTVIVQHPGSATAVTAAVAITPGDLITLRGDNGAGKTTLIEAIAGIHPSSGIERAHKPRLGQVGGTALIGQAPESQVLGLRVIDDLRWGMAGLDDAEADAVLDRVGLSGRADQPTEQLSGGELQRLAIGSTLIREPRLLLSDESTAMLDANARGEILDLLQEAAGQNASVLHSTHLADDLARFDHHLDLGETNVERPMWNSSPSLFRKAVLVVDDIGYVHDAGSPWESRALSGVSFRLERGELMVVRGPNGSGKTTLMRLLAGLIKPAEGSITFPDKPLAGPNPAIGVTFQHARLQLLRPTVRAEVVSLAGNRDANAIDDALRLVGFHPAIDGAKRIADLSGGQQRRVLLAGLSARDCKVVVMDEPLAGLDAAGRLVLTRITDDLLARGTAVIVVSHDPAWALERADHVVELESTVEVEGA
jgi:energy-coupling factor transporter ATP-binding protein EcfA2